MHTANTLRKFKVSSIAVTLISLSVLSGCSSNAQTSDVAPTPAANVSYEVPSTCELPEVNAAFARIIPPSKYIPANWQPAKGTDLYAALNNGGRACTYGDEDAEVGGTVMWALNANGLWDELVGRWSAEGLLPVDIPGIDETAAYKLPDGATSADGMPAWRINLLIGDIWIQLGAAFIQSFDEATPIIQAAINSAK